MEKITSKSEQSAWHEVMQAFDEARVKMHLGEMEAKQWWAEVEPQMSLLVDTISKESDKASASAKVFIDEMIQALRRVRDRLDARD